MNQLSKWKCGNKIVVPKTQLHHDHKFVWSHNSNGTTWLMLFGHQLKTSIVYNITNIDNHLRKWWNILYFRLNLDEICICREDGNLLVLCAKDRKTRYKYNSDLKFSIIFLRAGSTDGVNGPIIFLVGGISFESGVLKDLPKKLIVLWDNASFQH